MYISKLQHIRKTQILSFMQYFYHYNQAHDPIMFANYRECIRRFYELHPHCPSNKQAETVVDLEYIFPRAIQTKNSKIRTQRCSEHRGVTIVCLAILLMKGRYVIQYPSMDFTLLSI